MRKRMMIPKAILRLSVMLFLPFFLQAQQAKPAPGKTLPAEEKLLTPKDSLFLLVENDQKIALHRVKPKQTLYAIARYYSLSLEELYAFNPSYQTETVLKVGDLLRIPIPNIAIKRYKGPGFVNNQHVPIFYIVQQGETLYKICKTHFKMPVDTIVKRNKLKDTGIRPGQLLLMGWMQTDGIKQEWRTTHVPESASAHEDKFEVDKSKYSEVSTQGVCFWHRDSNEKGDLYALHRNATIGTIVEVTNPMSNRTVYAKVIGRIPDGYGNNTEIILSPEAARRLGARDPRFFVKIKYLK